MAEEKKKRGRPRKQPVQLPQEIKELIQEVENKQQIPEEKISEEIIPIKDDSFIWDVPIDQEIKFFDRNLSYELTGYKPINDKQGLDFDPEWFCEARNTYKRTGHYCTYPTKSKLYRDHWNQEYERCRNGMTVNGYTITGDHYFFLNYYQLNNTAGTKKAMSAMDKDFPTFIVAQYEYLHYLELCKRLRKNAALMKARAIGFSELNASITANFYSVSRNSTTLIVAAEEKKLTPTLNKLWEELSFLNYNTDGGFFKLRQVTDKTTHKKASRYEMINGQKTEVGFGSQVIGIVADSPDKVRGYRCGLLVFEEAGSFPNLQKATIQGEALLDVGGNKIGISLIGGTGGESRGHALEGLRNIYYNPEDYEVLPFRHNYTQNGEFALTGFFIPAFNVILRPEFLDSRGYTDPEKGKQYWLEKRGRLVNNPKALVDHCAERCFNAEEAFALEGENKFNKIYLSEQLTKIRALKQGPKIESGFIEYTYKNNEHTRQNITGFRWIPNQNSKLKILEHPIWTLSSKYDEEGKLIWSPPSEKIDNLYVIGIDGIDMGKDQTSDYTKDASDFCLVVLKRAYGIEGPKVVAYYKDRPQTINEAHKIAIKLAQYYNAIINIEATRISLLGFARDNKYLNYFMRRPRVTQTDIQRGNSKQYGTPATSIIIAHQTDLIANFIEDYYFDLWFEEILDQLLRYSDANKRKFDAVVALGMSLLADEELSGITPKEVKQIKEEWNDIGYYIDEKGIKRWGIIPKSQIQINGNIQTEEYNYNDSTRIRTSDPRKYYGYI